MIVFQENINYDVHQANFYLKSTYNETLKRAEESSNTIFSTPK